jgi:hypothetical protein
MRVPARSAAFVLAVVLGARDLAAQPTRTACGPGATRCGPAIAGTGTSTATAAPSWVSSMLAAWMLDEASGTRVNAQGNAALDLAATGAVAQTTTNKVEGVAAATFTDATTYLAVTAAPLSNLISPLSVGCWSRPTTSPALGFFAGRWGTHGYLLDQEGTNFRFYIRVSSSNAQTSGGGFPSINTYHHAVGTYNHPTITLYVDGVFSGSATSPSPLPTEAVAFQLATSNGAFQYAGQLDECFITNTALSAAAVCRICSCGLRGEQCICTGASYTSTGRNATACGACTLPTNCSAATPP